MQPYLFLNEPIYPHNSVIIPSVHDISFLVYDCYEDYGRNMFLRLILGQAYLSLDFLVNHSFLFFGDNSGLIINCLILLSSSTFLRTRW